MKVANKVIVVTGGGSGMGRELVLELLRRGARVAAVDLNETTLAETEELAAKEDLSANSGLATWVLNITDRSAVDALPGQVVERFGQVDGVINNAGIIQPFVRLNELTYDQIDRVFEVNFRGALYMTKAFLPVLLDRPEGHIVNTSSMGGFLPVPGQTIYGASKAAVKLMTEGLWAELRGTKVHVTVVFPGAVGTNITANSGVDMPNMDPAMMEKQAARVLPADKAARIILDGMEKNSYRVLVGSDARLMDVLYRVRPSGATAYIAKQMKALLK
jgi:NAD(P)-dependent dehydrogenase (short-subunit alcohol dehydrogenase family)